MRGRSGESLSPFNGSTKVGLRPFKLFESFNRFAPLAVIRRIRRDLQAEDRVRD